MSQPIAANLFYEATLHALQQKYKALKHKGTVMAWCRLAIVAGSCLVVYLFRDNGNLGIAAIITAGFGLFLAVIRVDHMNQAEIENTERLISINTEEIRFLKGDFRHREQGKEWEPTEHPYSNDLDIFGNDSMYQYLNRCNSQQGKQLLGRQLLTALNKQAIEDQQEAIKELSGMPNWYQQFMAYGMSEPISFASEQQLKNWMDMEPVLKDPYWNIIKFVFPIITITSIFLYTGHVISHAIFYSLIGLFFILATAISKKIHTSWVLLSRIVPELSTLHQQLEWFEQEHFNAASISQLKRSVQTNTNVTAFGSILALKKILNRFDLRLNVYLFTVLNTLLLWDLWQLLALNNWKKTHTIQIAHWFQAIAAMELNISLATLAFNKPDFCFPVIKEQHFTLDIKGAGHPLIPTSKCITNDFSLNGTGQISLVTGSNMGGKSTFLRTIGVNTVLAMIGAPVCADSFTISVIQLMSSMRIADNLAESTSTFYAELKKLKTIIASVNRKEKVFILLDEILRGTNSLDKHTGSEALIKQLIRNEAIGILATHDVELTALQEQYPAAISNYHFDVQVSGTELYFDYKLKQGICKSMNASILMQKIGIEL